MQVAEQHFNDVYRTCNDLKNVLENISMSKDMQHILYYVSQANDHIESIQQLVSTLYMILSNKQDVVTAMKLNIDQMVLDFDDEED